MVTWEGTAIIGGRIVPLTIDFGDTGKPIHGGTWNARSAELKGEITREEADRRIAACRLQRKQRRAASR